MAARKTLSGIITLMLLSLAACTLPQAGYGDVSGVVSDMETGEPMRDVRVVYGDSTILTAADGSYSYLGLPDGLQALSFVRDGYYSVRQQVKVPTGSSATCNVSMELVRSGWAVGTYDSNYGTILYTINAGQSWVRQGSSSQVPETTLRTVCAVDDLICWVAGDADSSLSRNVMVYTDNGGATWTNQNSGMTSLPLMSFASVVSRDGVTAWAVAADTCLIIKTTNSGTAWTLSHQSELSSSYSAIATLDGLNVWACGRGKSGGATVEYSPDGGTTWTEYAVPSSSEQEALEIRVVEGPVLYLSGSAGLGILRSDDCGQTWRQVQAAAGSVTSMDVYSSDRAWAVQDDGILLSTTDGFASSIPSQPAESVYPGGRITSLSFLRNAREAVLTVQSSTGATGTILRTADGGETWSEAAVPFNFSLEAVDFVGSSR